MANVVNDRDRTLLSTSPRTISTTINIGADAASFLRGKNGGTITPSSITLTAVMAPAEFATPTPTITWHYAVSSAPDTWISLAGSTLTKVISNSDSYVSALSAGEHLTFRAIASKSGYRTTEPAYFQISYSEEPGQPATVLLSRTVTIVQADGSGVVTVFDNTGTTITVKRGDTSLTYGVSGANTYSVGTPIISPAGKVTLDSSPTNGVFDNITAMATDTDSVTVTYPVTVRDASGLNPTVIDGIQTFTKVKAVTAGSSVTANLTQDFLGIPTDSAGNNPVFTNASTTMQVYVNSILQTAGWTYTVSALSNVSYRDGNDASDQTDTGVGAVIDPFPLSIKSLTADTGYLTISATNGTTVINKTVNVAKNKGGVDGATVTWYKISSSAPVIYKSSPDLATDGAHTAIIFTPQKIVGSAAPVLATDVYYTATAGNAAEAGTATAVTVDVTPTIANNADIDKYTFRIYNDAAKTTLLDSEIIPVVFRGANGTNGTSPPLITLTANGIAFTGASPVATTVTGDTININATIANSVEAPNFSARAYNLAGTELGTITLGDVSGTRTLTAAQFTNSGTWATRKVVITATLSTVSDVYTVYRVDNGGSVVQGALVNSAHTLPAYNNGTVSSYTGSGSVIRVAEGNTELQFTAGAPAAGQWAATRAQLTGIISPGSITISGLTGVMADHSGMTTDTAVVRVTITGKTLAGVDFPTILLDQTLTKSKQGTQGDLGDSSRRAYALFTGNPASVTWDGPAATLTIAGDNLPGLATVSDPNAATAWTSTIQNPSSGQAMFQSDGIYNGTNTVWQSPYLSNLKVGTLAAIVADLGAVSISSNGRLSSGRTTATGTVGAGFFLGDESGTKKFSIGTADNTKGLIWDGSDLQLQISGTAGVKLYNTATTTHIGTINIDTLLGRAALNLQSEIDYIALRAKGPGGYGTVIYHVDPFGVTNGAGFDVTPIVDGAAVEFRGYKTNNTYISTLAATTTNTSNLYLQAGNYGSNGTVYIKGSAISLNAALTSTSSAAFTSISVTSGTQVANLNASYLQSKQIVDDANWWDRIAGINATGVLEGMKYLDFHRLSGDIDGTIDYGVRLYLEGGTATGNGYLRVIQTNGTAAQDQTIIAGVDQAMGSPTYALNATTIPNALGADKPLKWMKSYLNGSIIYIPYVQ